MNPTRLPLLIIGHQCISFGLASFGQELGKMHLVAFQYLDNLVTWRDYSLKNSKKDCLTEEFFTLKHDKKHPTLKCTLCPSFKRKCLNGCYRYFWALWFWTHCFKKMCPIFHGFSLRLIITVTSSVEHVEREIWRSQFKKAGRSDPDRITITAHRWKWVEKFQSNSSCP